MPTVVYASVPVEVLVEPRCVSCGKLNEYQTGPYGPCGDCRHDAAMRADDPPSATASAPVAKSVVDDGWVRLSGELGCVSEFFGQPNKVWQTGWLTGPVRFDERHRELWTFTVDGRALGEVRKTFDRSTMVGFIEARKFT